MKDFYFYYGEIIQRFGKGWCLDEEMCSGKETGIPVYKTVEDARNRIRQLNGGFQKAEPRIIQTLGFDLERGWYVEE